MRRALLAFAVLILAGASIAFVWASGVGYWLTPDAQKVKPQTFAASLNPPAPDDTAFELMTLGDKEASLRWKDDSGVHGVRMSRRDFQTVFGVVMVTPRVPPKQEAE